MNELCKEFQLTPRGFYKYLQLRYTLQAQQQTHSLAVSSPLLMEVLRAEARKESISKIYAEFMSSVQNHASLKCRSKWMEDIGDIDGDQWDMALESIPAVSVSASHKLLQLFILHRTYRTPIQLHSWGRRDSPLCPKCRVHQDICFGDARNFTDIGRSCPNASPD